MERLPFNIGVCLQDLEQLYSEKRLLVGKLEGKGGEDCLKIAPVLKVSGAEEASPKLSICKCLDNG